MRLFILIGSVWAIAHAKPEMYKESEDFQYSRSSSDEGSKSGFYGAQRGNMGGNYERAHNMDGLAQHQMSTAVRQVEGELGEGAKESSGSVYTAANSRGIFGSGRYDLSNLKGRNFEESSSDALSHSSLISQNAGYRGLAHNSGYNSGYTKSSRQSMGYSAADYSEDHSTDFAQSKIVDNAQQAINQHSYGGQAALGSDYKYYSHGANRAQSQVIGANLQNAYDSYGMPITDRPVRVIMRPGTIVTVPVSAQTYDASSSSLRGTSYGQNSLSTEAEELSNSDSSIHIKPNTVYYTKPKHYESSYSYRKQWEKHNAQPVASIPTENPFAKNSELYDDSLLLQNAKNQFNVIDSSSAHVGSDVVRSSSDNIAHMKSVNAAQQSNRYHTKSSSGHQYNYEAAQSQNAAAHSNAYTLGTHNIGAAVDANDLVENIDTKPKSYHSSYSYHKSWERRGDPYVIKPVGGENSAHLSQRLVSGSTNQDAYSSHHYGSLYNQAHQSLTKGGVDCDENGHIRVARSAYGHYYPQQQEQQQFEDLGQQAQNQWDRLEDLGQQKQNQWDRLEDLGQQTQSKWDNNPEEGQQQHKWNNLQEFGQQSQKLEDFGQHSQNLEDFGQQSQNLEDFGQQSQNLEDFGQQSQNLEDFGQQSQNLEDLGQHTQNLEQQTQNQWDRYEKHNERSPSNIHQETQELESFQEPMLINQNMAPLSINSQQPESNEQKLNSFWDQHQNFEGQEFTQSTDQMRGFANANVHSDDQEFQNQLEIQKKLIGTMYDILNKQKENDHGVESSNTYNNPIQYHHSIHYNDAGNPYYTGYSHYSHQNSNNGISTSWQRNYQVQGNDNNNDQPTSLLQNFWSKLDNLDTQGNLNKNQKAHDDKSYKQILEDIDWGYPNLGQFHAQQNNQMYGSTFSSQREEKNFDTSQILNNSTEVSVLFSTESALTTVKPKYDSTSNIHVNPIDVGRGDIEEDETNVPANQNEHTNLYIPKSPQRHYKTTEEIESLSLTKENINNSKISDSQKSTQDKIINHHSLIGHTVEDVSSNTQESFTTTKAIEYKPTANNNPYRDIYNTPRISKINKQKEMLYDDKHKVVDTSDIKPLIFNKEQKNADQQDFLSSYDLEQQSQEPWKLSEIHQNTDQQIEDLGQQLEDTYDIGQHSKSSWEPINFAEQSQVQQLEQFGSFEHNSNQQFEPLERTNDKQQSQSFMNVEQNSWEPIAQNKLYDQQQSSVPSKIQKQVEQPSHSLASAPTSPEEVVTEKTGFWKSVGSKFTTAKDRVVSWFKAS